MTAAHDAQSSYETSTMWNGLVRTVYEFAAFPTFRKVEVMDNATGRIYKWQAQVRRLRGVGRICPLLQLLNY